MRGLYNCLHCSNHNRVSTESQTHSDAAGPSSVSNSTSSSSSAQKVVSRQSSTASRKSSSAKSDTSRASSNSVSQKFAPNTYQRVTQQRNLKASINLLVYLFYNCLISKFC